MVTAYTIELAEYIGGYSLSLTFTTGEKRVVDLSGVLDKKLFQPLKDKLVFQRFRIDPDLGTVVWENGADICPDLLCQISFPESQSAAI